MDVGNRTLPGEVTVHLFAGAAAELGTDLTSVRAATVAEALAALLDGASERARTVVGRSSVLVDGLACRDHGTELAPGARLDVLPPFAGG